MDRFSLSMSGVDKFPINWPHTGQWYFKFDNWYVTLSVACCRITLFTGRQLLPHQIQFS